MQEQRDIRLSESVALRTIGLAAHHVRRPLIKLLGPLEPYARDFGRRQQSCFEAPAIRVHHVGHNSRHARC
eukprot:8179758-Karenia_brevis.AAC.1